jgi:hypothetical protein
VRSDRREKLFPKASRALIEVKFKTFIDSKLAAQLAYTGCAGLANARLRKYHRRNRESN